MPQNEMPIMNIRAKYADETGSGQNIDEALANIAQSLLGKFARVVNASDIPSPLTDEWIEIFSGGVLVNGEIQNIKNPIFFSSSDSGYGSYEGFLAGEYGYGGNFTAGLFTYSINSTSKVLTIKQIPFITSNKGGMVLIDSANTNGIGFATNGSSEVILRTNTLTENSMLTLNGQRIVTSEPKPTVNIASEYDATATYALGALVIHEGLLYKCTTAIATAEEWDATHWTAVTMAELLSGITASQINSGSASNGQVLTANGSGRATWKTPTSELYCHIVKLSITKGSVTFFGRVVIYTSKSDAYNDSTITFAPVKNIPVQTQYEVNNGAVLIAGTFNPGGFMSTPKVTVATYNISAGSISAYSNADSVTVSSDDVLAVY